METRSLWLRWRRWLYPAIATVFVVVGVRQHWGWLTWALTGMLLAASLIADRRWQSTGRRWNRWTVIASVIAVAQLASGCAFYTSDPGPPVPPQVVGMAWAHDQPSTQCALGILADGSAFLSGVLGHPFLAAGIEWLAYDTATTSGPVGASLSDCWGYAQVNWKEFNLYTVCYGQPVLTTTWTSFSAAQAWIHIPTCRSCNQACQGFASYSQPWFFRNATMCDNALAVDANLVCFALAHPNGASVASADSSNPPPGTTLSTGPLPSSWPAPAWDTTIPAPPANR